MFDINDIPAHKPVLVAGPTASGKSALALKIAAQSGGVIVNADALQIYDNWPILSAQPSQQEMASVKHELYGHVTRDQTYSVGHWLRDIAPFLEGERPIIVGGTGLYFTALTEGLADIPPTPNNIRTLANQRVAVEGFQALLAELDSETRSRIDTQNPMRIQRAWEVLKSTGRPIWQWQDETPPPILPLNQCVPILLEAEKEWLYNRIRQRFDVMVTTGALEEATSNLSGWSSDHPSAKTIGASELIAYAKGELSLDRAQELVTVATRQYAKRQRTWFRSRMSQWEKITLPITSDR